MKNHTDLGQSKKLAEILQLEGADMYYSRDETTYAKTLTKHDITHANVLYGSCDIQYFNIREWTPCWSLAALLDILPNSTDIVKNKADTENEKYMCTVGVKNDIISTFGNNPVDACYDMIINLHKLSLI